EVAVAGVRRRRGGRKAHGLSEVQFKRELAGSWTTNLIELTHPAQLSIEHAGRLAEIGGAERGLHLPKIRIVENVECFGAELKLHTPEKAELPAQGEVHLPRPKSAENIPSEVAGLTRERRAKRTFRRSGCLASGCRELFGSRRRIVDRYSSRVGYVHIKRYSRNHVGTDIQA